MFPNVGMGELILILVIVLVLFGAKRVPEVAKGLGRSIRSFKEGLSDMNNVDESSEAKKPESPEEKP